MKRKSTRFSLFLLLGLLLLLWTPFVVAQVPEGREYIVQADDWLSKIAEKEYGDPLAYPSIVEATNLMADEADDYALIDNPDIIEIGQKLWLPTTLEDGDEAAAFAGMAASQVSEDDLLELDPSNFDDPTNIDNEWWPLTPGTRLIYEGITIEDDEEIPHRIVDTVTDMTKVINGVRTVISIEKDYSDDQLIEKEIAFHAQDNDGNVWHLGQLRETYDETEFVGGRVWMIDLPEGAKAGIRMEAEPQLGTPGYSQGYAPPPFTWTDRGRVYQIGQETEVATGSYEDVLVIEEWDAETEEDVFQLKYYARGVGLVRIGFRGPDPEQEEMELVEIVELTPDEMAEAREEVLGIEERAYMYAQTSPAEPLEAE